MQRTNGESSTATCRICQEDKWREFRPCTSLFLLYVVPQSMLGKKWQASCPYIKVICLNSGRRVHSRIEHARKRNGESSVYANGCFLVCTGCTVRSRCESCHKKNGEHSVHTNDCFAQCFDHTVHSERESCLEKNYESSVHVGCAVCS